MRIILRCHRMLAIVMRYGFTYKYCQTVQWTRQSAKQITKACMNESDDLGMWSLLNLDFIWEKWFKQMNKWHHRSVFSTKGYWILAFVRQTFHWSCFITSNKHHDMTQHFTKEVSCSFPYEIFFLGINGTFLILASIPFLAYFLTPFIQYDQRIVWKSLFKLMNNL